MHTHLIPLGWNDTFQLSFESIDNGTLIPARVTRENRGQYIVHTGCSENVARMGGAVRQRLLSLDLHPTVGDWLAVEPLSPNSEYTIHNLLPRKSHFKRQAAGTTSEYQSIAANFDYLFLVSGLDGDFNTKRIQRYLSQAWNCRAQPVIILNKADLVDDLKYYLDEVHKVAHDIPVKTICAIEPSSLECLREFLGKGTTIALLGSSGVGKSSLVNALLNENRLATQSVRHDDSRGRHTTTWRELVQTPDGTMLIDLPGMRELQLTDEVEGISKTFSDVEKLAKNCRFRNCHHTGEPGCAVEAAVDKGTLDSDRLHQFIKLKEENARAGKRRASRKKPLTATQQKRQDTADYFKEIHQQLRKDANARRKFFKGREN